MFKTAIYGRALTPLIKEGVNDIAGAFERCVGSHDTWFHETVALYADFVLAKAFAIAGANAEDKAGLLGCAVTGFIARYGDLDRKGLANLNQTMAPIFEAGRDEAAAAAFVLFGAENNGIATVIDDAAVAKLGLSVKFAQYSMCYLLTALYRSSYKLQWLSTASLERTTQRHVDRILDIYHDVNDLAFDTAKRTLRCGD